MHVCSGVQSTRNHDLHGPERDTRQLRYRAKQGPMLDPLQYTLAHEKLATTLSVMEGQQCPTPTHLAAT